MKRNSLKSFECSKLIDSQIERRLGERIPFEMNSDHHSRDLHSKTKLIVDSLNQRMSSGWSNGTGDFD